MNDSEFRTDWLGLGLSLLVPSTVVSGLFWAALQPLSWEDMPLWSWGLFTLVPLEGFRFFVTAFASDAYLTYRGPWQATKSFLGTIALMLCFVLVVMLLPSSRTRLSDYQDLATALMIPLTWQVLLVPMAVVVADSALGLLLFRGDARAQAQRVGAVAATSGYWFMVALVYPVCFVMPVGVLLLVFGSSRIVDPIWANSRMILLSCAALYFAGKAVLIAYLHTARFLRTGRLPIPRKDQDAIAERLGQAPTLGEIIRRQNRPHPNAPAESSRSTVSRFRH